MRYKIKSTQKEHHVQVRKFWGYKTIKVYKMEMVNNPNYKKHRTVCDTHPHYDFGLFQAQELLSKLIEK